MGQTEPGQETGPYVMVTKKAVSSHVSTLGDSADCQSRKEKEGVFPGSVGA